MKKHFFFWALAITLTGLTSAFLWTAIRTADEKGQDMILAKFFDETDSANALTKKNRGKILSPEEQKQVRERWESFKALPEAEKEKLRRK